MDIARKLSQKKVFTSRSDEKALLEKRSTIAKSTSLRGSISSGAIVERFVLLALLTPFRADNTVTFITSW